MRLESVGVALLIVGSFTLPIAFAGRSPGMRLGVRPPCLARIVPASRGGPGTRIRRTRVSDSAIFLLTGVTLLVTGLLLA